MGSHFQLLCQCARPDQGAVAYDTLLSAVDGEALRAAAARHRLEPLIAWRLTEHARDRLAPDFAAALGKTVAATVQWNLALARALVSTVTLLADAGIAALAYKGPVLAADAYGHLAARSAEDLDLLLPRDQVLRAKALLTAAGFRPQNPLRGPQERLHLRTGYHYNLLAPGEVAPVELHWRLLPAYLPIPLAPEELIARRREVIVAGQAVPTLSREDTVLALCAHGAKHAWDILGLVADLAAMLAASPELDWPAIVARSEALGIDRMVRLGLRLAHDLLGAPAPPTVLAARDPAVESLAHEVRERLEQRNTAELGIAETMRFHLRCLPRWRDRWRYLLLTFTPTSADWEALPDPAWLFPLWYVIRPVRLAWGTLVRRRRRSASSGAD